MWSGQLCNYNDLDDEFQYIHRCSFIDEDCRYDDPFIKFHNLFNETNHSKLRKTCKFLGIFLKQFRLDPG